jgi:hypothetical protein
MPSLSWMNISPYYMMKGENLIRSGSFASSRPVLTWLFSQLKYLYSAGIFSDEVLPPLMDSDYKYVCALIRQSKHALLEQFPGSDFFVYVHPHGSIQPKLAACLTQSQVDFYERPQLSPVEGDKIPIDLHPSAQANKKITADLLSIVTERRKGKPGSTLHASDRAKFH